MRKQWEEERVEMRQRIQELERKVEGLEKDRLEKQEKERNGVNGEERVETGGRRKGLEEKMMRDLEVRLDRREREIKKNNIVIKGVKTGEGEEYIKEVDRIWEIIGVVEGRKKIRRVGEQDREGRGVVWVELEGPDKKREVMRAKSKLKGERERIEDDLTVEERRVKWKMERDVQKERAQGNRVRKGYMKMWVNGVMKMWDEVGEDWAAKTGKRWKRRKGERGY
ncbi:golgin subfamily A member 6-like protein 2 [Cephus cinctus]|uniref:Golgin subfamily A member 6-like protein 2 n=1 Tax=Cephus cinctus TaxID=211228 RepID=A0AAJ7VYX1_CEPCN|nr:golgin subfamily A member 6-like protein 2 [Cephus cinctus]